jgi:hypothetical protein
MKIIEQLDENRLLVQFYLLSWIWINHTRVNLFTSTEELLISNKLQFIKGAARDIRLISYENVVFTNTVDINEYLNKGYLDN